MKRAFGWIVNIILVWLLVIVVALFLLPRFGGWRFDAVYTGSMEPELNVGGVVLIKPVEPLDIKPGDIIAYHSGEEIVTHRVVEVVTDAGEPSFVTKGDANEDPDPLPAAATSVVGKVIFDVPYLGYLAAFVKTRLGFVLTVILPGLAIIGLELKNMWQVVLKKKTAYDLVPEEFEPHIEMETEEFEAHIEMEA
ncbi:MAG: signal peptidase I [Dehalococcoidia bacterium]|nr:MAG: signal peptidase I [Dehalococcoidia bacterium]